MTPYQLICSSILTSIQRVPEDQRRVYGGPEFRFKTTPHAIAAPSQVIPCTESLPHPILGSGDPDKKLVGRPRTSANWTEAKILLDQGITQREAAKSLGISVRTLRRLKSKSSKHWMCDL